MRVLAAAAGAARRKIREKGKKGGKNLDKGRRKSRRRPTVERGGGRGGGGKVVPLGPDFPLKLVNQIQPFIFDTINSVSFLFRRPHHNGPRVERADGDSFLPPNCSQFKDKALPLRVLAEWESLGMKRRPGVQSSLKDAVVFPTC